MAFFTKTILPNGLRLVTVPKSDSLATTVLVLVEAGSEYEPKELNGLSHFLEHMVFKGTTKRPKSIQITNELNNIGAQYNAFTGGEYTGYWVKAQNKDTDGVLDVMSDLYIDPLFEQAEIDKERGVVIEEVNMNEDRLSRKAQELFAELLYGDQPPGRPIGGTKEQMGVFKRQHFLDYRKDHYLAPATTVVVAGGIDEKYIQGEVASLFKAMPQGEKKTKIAITETQSTPQLLIRRKPADQSHLVIGVRAFSLFDPRRYALELLSALLGGGFGSRLFERLREEMGVAYYVGAGADLSLDHGALTAYAGVDNARLEEVVGVVMEELARFTKEPVPEKEFQILKNRITGSTVLGLETSDALAMFYGEQELFEKKLLSPEETIKKMNAVTAEEIMSVAKDIMNSGGLNLAVIAPEASEEKLKAALHF